MATLNTQTSIVDYLTSKNQDSSFGARTNLAKQYGITGYTGSAEQNTLLLQKVQGASTPASPPAPTNPLISQFSSPSSVATSDPLRNAENQQKVEQQRKDQEEEQELLRLTRRQQIQQLQTLTTTGSPERPDLVGTFNKLREEQGIAGLETNLTDIRKQKLELKNQLNEFENRTSGQGRTQGEVDTAVGVESKKLQEQYDRLTTEESSLVDQLNTKNSVIETIINLTGKDYENAQQDYTRQFTQTIQTINTIKGITDDEKSDEERRQDNARANLQILANQLSSGDLQFAQLDPAQQAQINKLELQAGLPTGTIARIKDNNPKADIVSTVSRTDQSGNAFTDIVLRDQTTGALKVKTISRGKERIPESSGGGTDGFKFTRDQLQKASARTGIPLNDLNQLPGEVVNVFTSGEYDKLKTQIKSDLEDFISPSEIEKNISEEPALPDPVKDALVRYLKSEAKHYH
jgi:hypothetical protein